MMNPFGRLVRWSRTLVARVNELNLDVIRVPIYAEAQPPNRGARGVALLTAVVKWAGQDLAALARFRANEVPTAA